MNAVEALLTRASASVLTDPAPPADVVDRAMAAAARSPDHGRLRPWLFVTISGDDRKRFGDLMADSLKAREPGVPDSMLERERAKAMRAPLIVVVGTRLRPDRYMKVPEIEQVLSAGAAAQTLMLAFHAEGYGAVWKTGEPAYDPAVKRALGMEPHEHIVGILYVGTIGNAPPEMPRPHHSEFVQAWHGPVA
jgi:nitroreductase